MMGFGTRTGISMTEAKALALSAVWACIDIKSDVYASFPYKVYKKTNGGKGRKIHRKHPLSKMLGVKPNRMMNSFDFHKAKAVQILKNGNCYVIPKRNGLHEIEELFLVPNPKEVDVKEYQGDLHYWYKGQHYSSDEILHYKGFTLDGRIGVDPIAYHKETLSLGLAALFFGADVLGNGSIQPAVLETEQALKKEDADNIGAGFHESYGGLGAKSKVMPVLHSGLKYKPVVLEPDKAQYLGTKASVIEDVCRIFNVPTSIVHHHINSNYNSSEHQDLTFLKYSMSPFVSRIEAEDKSKLLTEVEIEKGSTYFKHNVDALLRPDFEKRTEGYSKLVNSGIITRNEARMLDEWDHKEGLDEPLVNANTLPSSELINYYQAKILALKTKNKKEKTDE